MTKEEPFSGILNKEAKNTVRYPEEAEGGEHG